MTDIFLSYNREDLTVARRFADAFERAGLSVWWDQTLDPGEAYDHVTEKALRKARAVVVLWSPRSVESRWVRAEATLAERNRTLVPVMIAPCERPIMFELTQTSDLSGWKGDSSDQSWKDFLASVQRTVARDGRSAATAPPTAPAPPTAAPHPAWRGPTVILSSLAVLGLLALVYGMYIRPTQPGSTGQTTPTQGATPDSTAVPSGSARPRIAVLPFQNLSPDPANAFFADGLHEEILTALTNSGAALDVISRTTMMTLRENPQSVAQIHQALRADYVVEGSVRRDQDDVRLTLQLINAKTDSHVWSQNFDRKLVSAMTLQSEVAGAVAAQLALQVSPAARALMAAPTRDPVAYDLYLQARLAQRLISGGSSEEAVNDIIDLYGKAIARDPDFGLAYLGRVSMGPDLRIELNAWLQQARQDLTAARRLLGDDPRIDLFEAINTIGGPWGDPARSLPLFDAAEARGLNDPEILNTKGTLLLAAGRAEEAIALRRKLISLDPANPRLLLAMAADSFVARQPEEALKAIDRMAAQLPPELAVVWQGFADETRFQYTGDSRWLKVPPADFKVPEGFDPAVIENATLQKLRFMGNHTEILQRLARIKSPLMPADGLFQSYNFGLPPPPVARLRGWTRLLAGDRTATRRDGREILAYKDLAPAYQGGNTNWLDRLRRAEGHLFAGEPDKAAAMAREGMALMPRTRNALLWDYATAMGAAILAWSDEQEEAVTLLERLAVEIPGLAPASITRDPIYAMPLQDNARFKALSARLEAQMAATKL